MRSVKLSRELRRLLGKRIVSFRLRPFSDGRGGRNYAPIIELEDGTRITFIVDESDSHGDYGVRPVVHRR